MNYKEIIDEILEEVTLPLGQQWITLDTLKMAAEELDGNKNGHNYHRLDLVTESNMD